MRFQIFVYMFVPWTEKIFKDDAGYFLRITKRQEYRRLKEPRMERMKGG